MTWDRSRRHRWGRLVWLGAWIVLASCTPLPSQGDRIGAATPEEAVRRSELVGAPGLDVGAQRVQIVGGRLWDQGRIVLYRVGDDPQAATTRWSYQFVEQGPHGWHATSGKGFNAAMFERYQSLRFRMDSVEVTGRTYVVLFGWVEVPGSDVEVQLMNQQVLRDTATPTLFLVLLPADSSVRELRVVNQHGQVVERIDVAPHLSGGT